MRVAICPEIRSSSSFCLREEETSDAVEFTDFQHLSREYSANDPHHKPDRGRSPSAACPTGMGAVKSIAFLMCETAATGDRSRSGSWSIGKARLSLGRRSRSQACRGGTSCRLQVENCRLVGPTATHLQPPTCNLPPGKSSRKRQTLTDMCSGRRSRHQIFCAHCHREPSAARQLLPLLLGRGEGRGEESLLSPTGFMGRGFFGGTIVPAQVRNCSRRALHSHCLHALLFS